MAWKGLQAIQPECLFPPPHTYTLVSLVPRYSTNPNPSVSLLTWQGFDPCGSDQSSSNWKGITCKGGRVVSFWTYQWDLAGTLPTSLALLTRLTSLLLSSNRLTGSVPTQVSGADSESPEHDHL